MFFNKLEEVDLIAALNVRGGEQIMGLKIASFVLMRTRCVRKQALSSVLVQVVANK